MRLKIRYLPSILILFLFLSSCSTLKPTAQDAKIYSAAKKIKAACFQTKNPNFSGQLTSTGFVPSIRIEGLWKDQYKDLNIQLEDVLGEGYGMIYLKNSIVKIDLIENRQIRKKDFDPLISFLSSLGSQGVRNLTCGNYAFDEQGNASNAILLLNDHKIKVQSSVELKAKSDKETVTIVSHFLYGIFANDSDIKVTWSGSIENSAVSVHELEFLFKNKDIYFIHFDEYQ